MASETEILMPENAMSEYDQLCCCCSIHGCVKDICTEYHDAGESEVYSEMIRSTFNINITHDEQTNLPHALYKQYICEQCISQLRGAYTFKVRLLKNHEAFLGRLAKWQKAGFKDEEINTKVHRIKSEWKHSEDETYDNCNNDVKVSTVKLENKSRKTNPETKVINRRKRKNLDGVKKTSRRTKNPGAAGTILRDNSLKLISNSTLWVFQWKSHGEFLCYICRQSYTDVEKLKNHTKTHTIQEIEQKITNSSNTRVKVEITDLSCKICNAKLENLFDLQKHLKIHNIFINNHLLIPFKLNHENKCQICSKIFKNFRLLKSHKLKHYQRFICEICGAEFYKKEYLLSHITNRHTDLKSNINRNKFQCRECNFNFPTYPQKVQHLVRQHGVKKPEFPCKLCLKVYIIKGLLNRHIKLTHLKEFKEKNYECDVCFKRFFRSHDVKRHKETHSEGLNYSCEVCNHSFKLKTSLGRHMRRMHK